MAGGARASPPPTPRRLRPQARREPSCPRTGRPRRGLRARTKPTGRRRRKAARPHACLRGVSPRDRTGAPLEQRRPPVGGEGGGTRVAQGVAGVRKAARERKPETCTALLHHLTVDLRRASFSALQRHAAPGVARVTWPADETGPGSAAGRPPQPGPPRGLSGAPLAESGHPEGRGAAPSLGSRRAGGSDGPTGGGDDPHPELCGRLSGLRRRVPAGTPSAPCLGGALGRPDADARARWAGWGQAGLLRPSGPRMARHMPPASRGRSSRPPPHPEMAAGWSVGGGPVVGDDGGYRRGRW
jgi:hypothetical protein